MTQPQKWNSGTSFIMMNFEDIVLSEKGQSQKDKYCRIPFIWGPWSSRFIEMESRILTATGWRDRRVVSFV